MSKEMADELADELKDNNLVDDRGPLLKNEIGVYIYKEIFDVHTKHVQREVGVQPGNIPELRKSSEDKIDDLKILVDILEEHEMTKGDIEPAKDLVDCLEKHREQCGE